MNTKELAAILNGREYMHEADDLDLEEIKKAGMVFVHGYSDDNIEFMGAIKEEVPCTTETSKTLFVNELGQVKKKKTGCQFCGPKWVPIQVFWGKDGYSWVIGTGVPHETFEIMEDGEKYCRGIVFSIEDLKKFAAKEMLQDSIKAGEETCKVLGEALAMSKAAREVEEDD